MGMLSVNRSGKVNSSIWTNTKPTCRPRLWIYLQRRPSGQRRFRRRWMGTVVTIAIQAWLSLNDPSSTHRQTGSDGTDRTRPSLDISRYAGEEHTPERVRAGRPSLERVRSSFERQRQSFDKLRPSFEQSRDFTSAAMLNRYESGYSASNYSQPLSAQATRRTEDIAEEHRDGR